MILGTAGHIDHGKTSLIRALTGTDTDRLPEEKRRGMTIELGFAELRIGDTDFGIVDVPGHERFVRTMVSGATGVDVALFVVAADDSVMPQTVEHVEIADLLGIPEGIVAVTKCDLVDGEMAELVASEVAELLANTRFASAPTVCVSATTGAGLARLREQLLSAAERVRRAEFAQPFRMPVDRVFTVAGRGTVVTGSVISGTLAAGDNVVIWPGGQIAKVREVQTHSRSAGHVESGQRAAINLQGVNRDEVERGGELAAPSAVKPTRWIDARLRCLASHTQPIRNHSLLRLCIGTGEVLARCVCLDGNDIAPGGSALVQLRCRDAITAGFGQRFIVRDENAARTAGGGVVLRAAQRRISKHMADEITGLQRLFDGTPAERVEEVVRYHGFDQPGDDAIALSAGVACDDVPTLRATLAENAKVITLNGTDTPLSARFVAAFERRAGAWLETYHRRNPDVPGCLLETFTGFLERTSRRNVARAVLDRMIASRAVKIMGNYVCLAAFAPQLSAEDERVMQRMLALFADAGFQPPSIADLVKQTGANKQRIEKLIKVADSLGQLVRIDATIYLDADTAGMLRDAMTKLHADTGAFTVSQMREALGTSRKFAVPFAEYLDRTGITQRRGDTRIVVETKSEIADDNTDSRL
ncbi:MAG: selenocysteine-specific translation elongation factor [Phycisphaerales bacterium]|nr:selenocysteine-specific translation elongation factor [Phycisphaerales bacterium]